MRDCRIVPVSRLVNVLAWVLKLSLNVMNATCYMRFLPGVKFPRNVIIVICQSYTCIVCIHTHMLCKIMFVSKTNACDFFFNYTVRYYIQHTHANTRLYIQTPTPTHPSMNVTSYRCMHMHLCPNAHAWHHK